MKTHITVGVPVYQGSEYVARALASLQEQTHREFDVLISVDGKDEQTADACRPFLSDQRFRLVVQEKRLDWNGNLNFLLQQPMGDFFCYRQHDDTTTSDFFEQLLTLAEARPDAAIVYADCQWIGGRSDLEYAPELDGDVFSRMRRFIAEKQAAPVRGLIRAEAARQAGLVRIDEFRGLSEVFVWLAKLLRWGPFLRLPKPLYIRLDHAENFHKQWWSWPEPKKREAWATFFTGLLQAVDPVCSTVEQKLMFETLILERVAIRRPVRSYHYNAQSPDDEGAVVKACYGRLRKEGLLHLSALAPMLAGTLGGAGSGTSSATPAQAALQFEASRHRAAVPKDFDAKVYLTLHPDVLAADIDPYFHYLRHGAREGRRYKQ